MLRLFAILILCLLAPFSVASELTARPGWEVLVSQKDHATLVKSLSAAVKENGLIVVTRAGPTKAAANRGITIPGNLVMGVFNNDYAVRVLETSTAAMIEAPIRFYVTESPDGSGTLSYKTPDHVFAPYVPTGGAALREIANELTQRFDAIAKNAIR